MQMSYKKATESNIKYDEFTNQVKHIGIQRCVYATVGGTDYFIFMNGTLIQGMDLTDHSITTLATITASMSMGAAMVYLESGEPRVHWFRSESISPTSFDLYEGTAAYDAGTNTWSGLDTNTFLYNLSTEPTHYYIVGTECFFMTNSRIHNNAGSVLHIASNDAVFNVLGPNTQGVQVYWNIAGEAEIRGSGPRRNLHLPMPTTPRFENQFFYLFDDLEIAVTNEYIKFKHPLSYTWKTIASATSKIYQSAPIWNKDTLEPTYVTFNDVIYKITTTSPVPIQALANGFQGGIVGGIEEAFFNIPTGLVSADFFDQYEMGLTEAFTYGGANPELQAARIEGLRGTLLLPERPDITHFLDCYDSGGDSVYLAKILNVEELDDNAYLCATTSALNLDLERGVDQRFYHKSSRFILETLLRQTCYYILYTASNITDVGNMTIDLTNISLAEALARIEVKTGLWASLDAQGNLYLNNTGQDKGALSLDSLALTGYPTRSYLGMQAQACIVYGARNPHGGLYYGLYEREVGQGVLEAYNPELTSNADCEDYAEDLITTQEVEIIVLKRARFVGNYIDDYFPGSKVSLTLPFFDYTAETFYVTDLEYKNAQLTTTLSLTSAIFRYYKNRSLNEINYLATSEVNLGMDLIQGLFPAAYNFGGLERGYYPAYESFWNVEEGAFPIRWDLSVWGAIGGEAYVLREIDGHKNVLYSKNGQIIYPDLLTPPTSTFTMTFWWRTGSTALSSPFAFFLDRCVIAATSTHLQYSSSSSATYVNLQTYNINQWYHIRIVFNDTAATFNIFIDGVALASGVAYTVPSGDEAFGFGTHAIYGDTADLYFDGIDFSWADGYYLGRNRLMPAGWTDTSTGGNKIDIIAEMGGHAKVLELMNFNTGRPQATLPIALSDGDNFELYFRATDVSKGQNPGLFFQGATQAVNIYVQSGNLYYTDGSAQLVQSVSNNQWYHLRLTNFDFTANTFDLWVDGVEMVTGAGFQNAASALDLYKPLMATGADNNYLYLDAVDFSGAPDYYVGRNAPVLYKWLRGELS